MKQKSIFFWYSNNGLSAFANTDPLDGHRQILFNEPNVFLCVFGQLIELPNVFGACVPARQRGILDFDLGQIGNGAWEMLDTDAVQFVAGGHLDFSERVQNVQFGQTDGRVAVHQRRVVQQHQIEPAATTFSLGGDTNFSSA